MASSGESKKDIESIAEEKSQLRSFTYTTSSKSKDKVELYYLESSNKVDITQEGLFEFQTFYSLKSSSSSGKSSSRTAMRWGRVGLPKSPVYDHLGFRVLANIEYNFTREFLLLVDSYGQIFLRLPGDKKYAMMKFKKGGAKASVLENEERKGEVKKYIASLFSEGSYDNKVTNNEFGNTIANRIFEIIEGEASQLKCNEIRELIVNDIKASTHEREKQSKDLSSKLFLTAGCISASLILVFGVQALVYVQFIFTNDKNVSNGALYFQIIALATSFAFVSIALALTLAFMKKSENIAKNKEAFEKIEMSDLPSREGLSEEVTQYVDDYEKAVKDYNEGLEKDKLALRDTVGADLTSIHKKEKYRRREMINKILPVFFIFVAPIVIFIVTAVISYLGAVKIPKFQVYNKRLCAICVFDIVCITFLMLASIHIAVSYYMSRGDIVKTAKKEDEKDNAFNQQDKQSSSEDDVQKDSDLLDYSQNESELFDDLVNIGSRAGWYYQIQKKKKEESRTSNEAKLNLKDNKVPNPGKPKYQKEEIEQQDVKTNNKREDSDSGKDEEKMSTEISGSACQLLDLQQQQQQQITEGSSNSAATQALC